MMAYGIQTREQILEVEVEELRFRLNELLGTETVCPLPEMNGAKFRIVNLLANRSPRIVAHEALVHAMSGSVCDLDKPINTLKVHVFRARKALKAQGIEIHTAWGLGYRISPEDARKWQALVEAANPTPHNLEDAAA